MKSEKQQYNQVKNKQLFVFVSRSDEFPILKLSQFEMNEQQEYQIEQILAAKFSSHRNRFFYLVKWVNWPIQDSTWEPEENFQNSMALLKEFKEQQSRNKLGFKWEQHQSLRQFWGPQYQKPTPNKKTKPKTHQKQPQNSKLKQYNIKNKKIQKLPKPKKKPGRKSKKDQEQIEIKQIDSSSSQQNNYHQFQVAQINEQSYKQDPKIQVKNKICQLINRRFNSTVQLSQPQVHAPTKQSNSTSALSANKMEQQNQSSNRIKQTTKSQEQNHQQSKQSQQELSREISNTSSKRNEIRYNYDVMYEEEDSDSESESKRNDQDYVCEQEEQEDREEEQQQQQNDDQEYKPHRKYNFLNESKVSKNNNMFESPFLENQQSNLNHGIFDDIITNIKISNREKKEEEPDNQQPEVPTVTNSKKIDIANKNSNLNSKNNPVNSSNTNQNERNVTNVVNNQPETNRQLINGAQSLVEKQKYTIVGIRHNKNKNPQSKYEYVVLCKQNGVKQCMSQFEVFMNCPLSLIQYYEQKVNFGQPQRLKRQPPLP